MVTSRESLPPQLETGNRGEALERECHYRSWELSGAMKLLCFLGGRRLRLLRAQRALLTD